MAISDYAYVAFNNKGPASGVFKGLKDTKYEIRKNSIYVIHKEFQKNSTKRKNNYIGSLSTGESHLFGDSIYIEKSKCNDNINFVFIISSNYYYRKAKKPKERNLCSRRKMFAAIYGYGWDDPLKRMYAWLEKEDAEDLPKFEDIDGYYNISSISDGVTTESITLEANGLYFEYVIPEKIYEKLQTKWVGITKLAFEEFKKWLSSQIDKTMMPKVKEWADKIVAGEYKAYVTNQGDNFLANTLGFKYNPNLITNKQNEPFLVQALKENKDLELEAGSVNT